MMLPECAALGTLTSRPAAFARRCAPGDLRLMRAPGRAGNATVNPALSPLPVSSSVPCTETWCGFALHLVCGVQVTLVMRTEVTCALGLRAAEVPALRERPLPVAAGPLLRLTPPACAPPGPVPGAAGGADAAEAEPAMAPSSAAVMTDASAAATAAARISCGLCARVLAIGSLRASCFLHPMAASEVSRYAWQNTICASEVACHACVRCVRALRAAALSPSESLRARAPAAADLRAGPRACLAG